MRNIIWIAAAAAALTCGTAQAQPAGRSATLYELPNFQGRSVTLTGPAADLGDWRFNDRAQSARFRGTWRACEHDDFRGRCQELRGDVENLHQYGLMAQISSLEPAGGIRPGPGPGPRPDWDDDRPGRGARGHEGTRTVFFPRPAIRGLDVAAGRNGADMFCRRQGLGPAVWYDSSERAPQAVGPDGEVVGRSDVLRDLLCRRW